MYDLPLSGAQKKHLRSLGQQLDPVLKLGKGGVTPAFLKELQLQLRTHELIKLRILGLDRTERDALCAQLADEGRCLCIGAIGHTGLFYRQQPDPSQRKIILP
ncbi:MAG: YhbY family RNA-binding protein [Cephaloticoccus sp.]|nr:YhbY family RNA-binding protein [Cephaloticoccus sp.]MCF7759473.1 YhbY family RNA-binding protein [Cephaloticoccus sp.]